VNPAPDLIEPQRQHAHGGHDGLAGIAPRRLRGSSTYETHHSVLYSSLLETIRWMRRQTGFARFDSFPQPVTVPSLIPSPERTGPETRVSLVSPGAEGRRCAKPQRCPDFRAS